MDLKFAREYTFKRKKKKIKKAIPFSEIALCNLPFPGSEGIPSGKEGI